jgi:hypothetical protein
MLYLRTDRAVRRRRGDGSAHVVALAIAAVVVLLLGLVVLVDPAKTGSIQDWFNVD